MRLREWLAGKPNWIFFPTTPLNVLVGAMATAYAYATLSIPPSMGVFFVALVCISMTVFTVAGRVVILSRLKSLRLLATGASSNDTEVLNALGELQRTPDNVGRSVTGSWLAATATVAFAMRVWGGGDTALALRLFAVGLLFGPMSAVLSALVVIRRSRSVFERLAEHLPPSRVLEAMPRERPRVQARMVLFTAVLVVLPSLLMIDVSRAVSHAALSRWVQEGLATSPNEVRLKVYSTLLILMLLVIGFGLVIAYLSGEVLSAPLKRVAETATRMAKGELVEPRLIAASDEVWDVASTFTLLQTELYEAMLKLKGAGDSIATTTQSLVSTSSRFESGAASQASSLNETSATTEELATSARQIAASALAVASIAQKALDAAQEGQNNAEAFILAIDRMRQDNRSIAQSVERLQKRVQQIGRIVEFINAVADRSDLLALSAELEGTKAGDVGRGFTLVASEMRRLAENVLESTNEIVELIGEIREATSAVVAATDLGLKQTEGGTSLAEQVARALAELVAHAQATSQAARAISLATQQQQTGTDQLAEAMADILGITQQSLAATKQLAGANNELMALATELNTLVERFRAQA